MPRTAREGWGRRHPSWAESSLAGLSSLVYKDRVRDGLQGPAVGKDAGAASTHWTCVFGEEGLV